MTARRFLLISAASLMGCGLLAPMPAIAQDNAQVEEVENSRYQFTGRVTANSVYVRAGAGEGYYATMKLDKGAEVVVVGHKFDWLKILPPPGSFSYIAQAYVERQGDGTIGRVTRPNVNVRTGSLLNTLKTYPQTQLNENDRVVIIGPQDEYFKIEPPPGAYVYISKQFVEPVKAIRVDERGQIADATTPPSTGDQTVTPTAPVAPEVVEAPQANDEVAAAPSTQPAGEEVAAAPATQPVAEVSDEQKFDAAEVAYAQAMEKPLQEQPLAELLAMYEPLATSTKMPESMRRIAEYRVAVLKSAQARQEQLVAVLKEQEADNRRRQAAAAEREELQERIRQNEVNLFAAVGELRPSSIQRGGIMLYRLTDPANGRTVVYIRSEDPKSGTLIGSFVGVKGQIITDTQLGLKVITPDTIVTVDPTKVGSAIVATIMPPSMLPKSTSTSE